jgi:spore maturation protein CgeB
MIKVLIVGDSNWHGSWTESTISAFKAVADVDFFSYLDNAPTLRNIIRDKLIQFALLGKLYKKHAALKSRLERFLSNKTYDLILVLRGDTLEREEILLLREHTRSLCTWWVDNVFDFPNFLVSLDLFDVFYIFDSFYIEPLLTKGCKRVHYLPCASNTITYSPGPVDKDFECDIGFVGSYFPSREKLFENFTDSSLKIKIWGPSWQRSGLDQFFKIYPDAIQGSYLSNQDATKLYRSAKILLNHNAPQTRYDGLNQRTFEILSCKAFQLVDFRDGFTSIFKDKKELVYFYDPAEIPELVSIYLEKEKERRLISVAGFDLVSKDHSFDSRVKKILETIGV